MKSVGWLLFATASAGLQLFPRAAEDNLPAHCVPCTDVPTPCPPCPANQICVAITRSCSECASNVCRPVTALASPQTQKPEVAQETSSGVPYFISVVCGVGAAVALAVGGFLWYSRRPKPIEFNDCEAPQLFLPSKIDRVSAASSAQWDIGSNATLENVNETNDALAELAHIDANTNGASNVDAPLLPDPVQSFDNFLDEFKNNDFLADRSSKGSFQFPAASMKRSSQSLSNLPGDAPKDMPNMPATAWRRHTKTVSSVLTGTAGDRLSAVGSGSSSRIALSKHPKRNSTNNFSQMVERPMSEREKRRQSMVREAMKRASVVHV